MENQNLSYDAVEKIIQDNMEKLFESYIDKYEFMDNDALTEFFNAFIGLIGVLHHTYKKHQFPWSKWASPAVYKHESMPKHINDVVTDLKIRYRIYERVENKEYVIVKDW